jgi:hypothetical protein
MHGHRGSRIIPLVVVMAVLSVDFGFGGDAHDRGAGAWSERTQLTVDEVTQALVRRPVKVWSPADLVDFDVSWRPRVGPGVAADGAAQGSGTLQWREAGAASHDHSAVVATYVGEVRGGRAHGYGSYRDRSGRSYEGTWERGFMSGSGLLRTPDGRDYEGEVRDGVPYGKGQEAAVDGTSYRGAFKGGLRDGLGVLTKSDGTNVTGIWSAGNLTDDPIPTKSAEPIQLAQAGTGSAAVTVYVDRALNQKDDKGSDMGIVLYEQDTAGGVLRLRPKLQGSFTKLDILGIWKGNKPIEKYYLDYAYGPANLTVDVKNTGVAPLQIVDGYVEVADSVTDLQPFLTLSSDFDAGCANEDTKLDPTFTFRNSGWGKLEDAKVTYNFTREFREGGQTASLGTFLDTQEMSAIDGLRNLGVNVRRLEAANFPCESRANVPQCLRRLIDGGVFGRLPASSIRRAATATGDKASSIIVTDVTGSVQYSWTDAKGAKQERRSPFTIEIPLLAFRVGLMAECGAGGPTDPDHPIIKLKLDEANYRLPIQYRATLRPGQNNRLGLSLNADKSSQHKFRIVIRLSDNSVARSGPIELLYFNVRDHAPDNNPRQ